MVSYIKGGMQAKGIWKQDPDANIWVQEGWEWGMEKTPQEENSYCLPFIYSGWFNIEDNNGEVM